MEVIVKTVSTFSNRGLETQGMRLLDVQQAARYLGMSTHLLYRWRSQGIKLPVVKVSRSLRYDVRDLDQFIREHKIGVRNGEHIKNSKKLIWP